MREPFIHLSETGLSYRETQQEVFGRTLWRVAYKRMAGKRVPIAGKRQGLGLLT